MAGTILTTPPCRAEIRSGNDVIGRVSIVGPISVVEKNGRRLSAIIRTVIKVIYGAVVAAVGNPNDAIKHPRAHLVGNIGPTVVGFALVREGPRRSRPKRQR